MLAYLNTILCVVHSSTSKTMNTLSTYDVNQAAIAFLSNMIENANGREVSATCDELLDQHIQLVKSLKNMQKNSWQEAEKYADIIYQFEAPFAFKENFQKYCRASTKASLRG